MVVCCHVSNLGRGNGGGGRNGLTIAFPIWQIDDDDDVDGDEWMIDWKVINALENHYYYYYRDDDDDYYY